jgi:hypothetical protein
MPVPANRLQSSGPISFSDLNTEFRGSGATSSQLSMSQLGYGRNIIRANVCTGLIRSNPSSPYYPNIGTLQVFTGSGSNMTMSRFYSKWCYAAPPNGAYTASGTLNQFNFNAYYSDGRSYNLNSAKRLANPLFIDLLSVATYYSSAKGASANSALIPNEGGGTIAYFDNNGAIYGSGGDGGSGGNGTGGSTAGTAGQSGGTALRSTCERLYLNNDGLIYGGGGGGGGGTGAWTEFTPPGDPPPPPEIRGNGGGGGGGGQGFDGYGSSDTSNISPFIRVVDAGPSNEEVYLSASGTGSGTIRVRLEVNDSPSIAGKSFTQLTIRSNGPDIDHEYQKENYFRQWDVNITSGTLYRLSFSGLDRALGKDPGDTGESHTVDPFDDIPKNTQGLGIRDADGNDCNARFFIKEIISQDTITGDPNAIVGGQGGPGGSGTGGGDSGSSGTDGSLVAPGVGGAGGSGSGPNGSAGGNGGGFGATGASGGSGGGAGGSAILADAVTYIKQGTTIGTVTTGT